MNTAFKEYFTHNNIIIALTTIKDTKEYYHFITCNTSLPTTYIYDMANNIINNRPLYSQSTMQPANKIPKGEFPIYNYISKCDSECHDDFPKIYKMYYNDLYDSYMNATTKTIIQYPRGWSL